VSDLETCARQTIDDLRKKEKKKKGTFAVMFSHKTQTMQQRNAMENEKEKHNAKEGVQGMTNACHNMMSQMKRHL
jgi:hypothetical protein